MRPDSTKSKLVRAFRWWRAPFWILAVATGAKSFVDNPFIGSRRLNRAGLHITRMQAAHWLAARRRRRLGRHVPQKYREQFDRDGFVCIEEFLGPADFEELRAALLDAELPSRSHQQGDTVTRRTPVGPELRRRVKALNRLLDRPDWRSLMAYAASTRSVPLYYLQTIFGGCVEGAPDPQIELHSDTFHPSMKGWLFLTDVADDDRPLVYVPGSHRLTPARLQWEKRKSETVLESGDRLSQRGSLRVSNEELQSLGLGKPHRFAVPANTLVIVDTCGFHARANSDGPTVRVELWAYSRRTPFLPWAGADPFSWKPIADRRAEWINIAADWLDRRGWRKQHWRLVEPKRPLIP